MVVHYSQSNIAAISELVNIPANSLKRRRYSSVNIVAKSQTDLTERVSREHYLDGKGTLFVKSIASLKGKPKRLRNTSCDINAVTKINISDLLVLPLPIQPFGKLILNGSDLNKQRLKSGVLHNLIFEVQGSKIAGMQLEFQLEELNGSKKIYKTLFDIPGGIYEESVTETSSIKIQVGTIPILRDELNIEVEEQEFRFKFFQSNNFLNLRFELNSGILTVYR